MRASNPHQTGPAKYSELTILAIQLEDKLEGGILPGPGGWLDQDFLYVTLIDMASTARRRREAVENEKRDRLRMRGRRGR